MKVTTETAHLPFGTVTLITATLPDGSTAQFSSLGAGITRIALPGPDGELIDVAMRYDSLESYIADGPCAGKTAGRYANRIGYGRLTIDGRALQLAVNCGPHHLHGGPGGFQNQIWEAETLADGARFTLRSPDGDENYPGEVLATVTYHWLPSRELTIEYTATANATTVVNLTNHTYFNLDGIGTGTALGHILRLVASHWAATDPTLLPTGELSPVAGTPMDFTEPKELGRDIREPFPALQHGKGYDHCYALDGWRPGHQQIAAVLVAPRSRRRLTILTDQPGIQLYTGNWLTGSPTGPGGLQYEDYDCVALECQGFPDAPNRPEFPSQELRPGQEYRRRITYAFDL